MDAGFTISEAREILVQLCAYAGFPRSLNALAELLKVVEERKLIEGLEQWGDTAAAGRARTALTEALATLNIRE